MAGAKAGAFAYARKRRVETCILGSRRSASLPCRSVSLTKSRRPGPVYRIPPPHWLVPVDRVPARGASRGLPLCTRNSGTAVVSNKRPFCGLAPACKAFGNPFLVHVAVNDSTHANVNAAQNTRDRRDFNPRENKCRKISVILKLVIVAFGPGAVHNGNCALQPPWSRTGGNSTRNLRTLEPAALSVSARTRPR